MSLHKICKQALAECFGVPMLTKQQSRRRTHSDEIQVALANIDGDGAAVLFGLPRLAFSFSKADLSWVQLDAETAQSLAI